MLHSTPPHSRRVLNAQNTIEASIHYCSIICLDFAAPQSMVRACTSHTCIRMRCGSRASAVPNQKAAVSPSLALGACDVLVVVTPLEILANCLLFGCGSLWDTTGVVTYTCVPHWRWISCVWFIAKSGPPVRVETSRVRNN